MIEAANVAVIALTTTLPGHGGLGPPTVFWSVIGASAFTIAASVCVPWGALVARGGLAGRPLRVASGLWLVLTTAELSVLVAISGGDRSLFFPFVVELMVVWAVSSAPHRLTRLAGDVVLGGGYLAASLSAAVDPARLSIQMVVVAITAVIADTIGGELLGAVDSLARQRRLAEHAATHDQLTGLLNRAGLLEALRQTMTDTRRTMVCYVDLDAMKHLNDRFGHRVGDQLLVVVAERLCHAVRPEDHVGRLGGDEFAVVVPDPGDPTVLAVRLLAHIGEPIFLAGAIYHPHASIGVSMAGDATDPEVLLDWADIAMYQAKHGGGHRVAFSEAPARSEGAVQGQICEGSGHAPLRQPEHHC